MLTDARRSESSHLLDEVEDVCDRVAILRTGKLVPAESFAISTALVMLAVGAGLALAGQLLFNRRDVAPA